MNLNKILLRGDGKPWDDAVREVDLRLRCGTTATNRWFVSVIKMPMRKSGSES